MFLYQTSNPPNPRLIISSVVMGILLWPHLEGYRSAFQANSVGAQSVKDTEINKAPESTLPSASQQPPVQPRTNLQINLQRERRLVRV